MAKGKKKHKGEAGAAAGGAFAALATGIAGQALGQLVADGIQRKAPALFGGPNTAPDLTARMLMTLDENGPRTVAELVDALDAPVQTLLDAVTAARRAKLVARLDKSAVVRITEPGCAVAKVVRRKVEEQGQASHEESTAADGGG
jgi:hypothetical protein